MSVTLTEERSTTERLTTHREAVPIRLNERAPFRHRAATALDMQARVLGDIPGWLRGDLVRCAPSFMERTTNKGTWLANHWFDGLSLLYAFRIGADGIGYRQRLMETDVERASREAKSPSASFGSPIQRSFWRRLVSPLPTITDNTNVNVLGFGSERVALTESRYQWVFDPETLEAVRRVNYTDSLGKFPMIAHAHLDFARDRILNVGTEMGMRNALVVYEHAPESRSRKLIGRHVVSRMPYMHGFSITPRHVVLIGHPMDFNPMTMLWSNRGFIDHFEWSAERYGMRLWLMDRATGQVREHEAPPGFVFHPVNAFEDGPETVLDVALYPDATVIEKLNRASFESEGFPELTPSLVRYRMTPNKRDARVDTLLADGFEFPSIHYRRANGEPHRVAWGSRIRSEARGLGAELIRWTEREVLTYSEPDMVYGEPIFVATPDATAEDDGVLLAVGAHRRLERSSMIVVDAQTMQLRGRADIDVPIPLGFHGSFFRS